jgi:hypothetical protein
MNLGGLQTDFIPVQVGAGANCDGLRQASILNRRIVGRDRFGADFILPRRVFCGIHHNGPRQQSVRAWPEILESKSSFCIRVHGLARSQLYRDSHRVPIGIDHTAAQNSGRIQLESQPNGLRTGAEMMLRTVFERGQLFGLGTGVSALLHRRIVVAGFQSRELKDPCLVRDGPGTGGAGLPKPYDGVGDTRAGDFVHHHAFDRDGALRGSPRGERG